ncbi:MAG: lipid IV(A) 3-deoxy-D-manno-octulosonic acid transferase [Xanthomonadales bacterium]|jgi:3-deoxy-D-manno-octulosonic-acid transferase|nr:lipid IV(A) 3-deoxy-D-manno-octulosonic acid transferase [Xanthomonadales bacterium]
MRRLRLLRLLYTVLVHVATPFILYRLAFRGIRQRSYLDRWRERFGFFDKPDFTRSIVVHAVSVGEFNAAIPLIEALMQRFPEHGLVVTTITPTGSERVRKVLGRRVFHVYLPYDLPGSIRRFLRRVRPELLVIMETEIWPNLYFTCKQHGVPILIANARLSERSLKGYGPGQPLAQYAVRCASWIAAQSQSDAERFLQLGAEPSQVEVVGNVKFDMPVPTGLAQRGREQRARWGTERPVWMAASTHEGEEQAVLTAHAKVLQRFPDALLLLAPRHPERFRAAAARCRAYGFNTRQRSEENLPGPDTQCFVIDTLGELLQFYASADVAFVAGSLEPIGGHNTLEAAAIGVPVLIGPHTFNFEEISERLLNAGAALRIDDADTMGQQLQRLLAQPALRQQMGAAGMRSVAAQRGAVQRIVDAAARLVSGSSNRAR